MHRRRHLRVVALVAAAVACTGTTGDERPDPTDASTATGAETVAEIPAPTAPAAVDRLVVVDSAGNVVTMNPDGTGVVALTDDADEGSLYFQPQWSPDSRSIAWGEARSNGFAVVTTDPASGARATMPTPALPFYLFWSPDSRYVAMLHNSPAGGLDLELVNVAESTSRVAASGAPFYVSWSPDATRVAAHIGSTGFSVLDTGGGTTDLGNTSDAYLAPQWTPAGILHLEGDAVTVLDVAGDSTVLATVPGPVTFLASPDGSRIAIQALIEGRTGVNVGRQVVPAVPGNVVAVLDVATGEIEVVAGHPALAYFWSPDGAGLLILLPATARGETEWLVWNGTETRSLGTFAPSPSFVRDVLPFFPQYAQSLTLWSPGSDSFAFVGRIDTDEGIWVQPIDGSPPRLVSTGTWVAWSSV